MPGLLQSRQETSTVSLNDFCSGEYTMTTLTIRNLENDIQTGLRQGATRHGRTTEKEARTILRQAVATTPEKADLGTGIHRRYLAIFGTEDASENAALVLPERKELACGVDFES